MSAQTKYGLAILILTLIPTFVYPAYRCIDENGKTTFQNTACPSNAKQEKTKLYEKNSAKNYADASKEFKSEETIDYAQAMLIRQQFASAISSLTPLKLLIGEHYTVNGSWPNELSEIGFNSDSMNTALIDSVKLDANGALNAKLNDSLGTNKQIVLLPKSVMGGTSIEWSCYTNFTKDVLTSSNFEICKSSANPELMAASLSSPSKKSFLRPGEKRMLKNYEERGRKLIEAKRDSLKKAKEKAEWITQADSKCRYHKNEIEILRRKLRQGYRRSKKESIDNEISMHEQYLSEYCNY